MKRLLQSIFRQICPKYGLNRQEALFALSLEEKGIRFKRWKYKNDHINGINYYRGVPYPIIYPTSYFIRTISNLNIEKSIEYYFDGYIDPNGGRHLLLKRYMSNENSIIRDSDFGRRVENKYSYNQSYFDEMLTSKFALVPHQMNWQGPKETIWTYRFIEACMTFSIPILFRETPLGDSFIDGFKYYYSDEKHEYIFSDALHNYQLAISRFTLTSKRV